MAAIKRYLVFSYTDYYPKGGWDDLIGMADTENEAIALLSSSKDKYDDNYRIVDTQDIERLILNPSDKITELLRNTKRDNAPKTPISPLGENFSKTYPPSEPHVPETCEQDSEDSELLDADDYDR